MLQEQNTTIWFTMVLGYCMLLTVSVYGNNNKPHGGARDGAMAGASTTHDDVFAVFNNNAGLAWNTGIRVGLYNESRFGIRELATNGLCLAYGTQKNGTLALGIKYFGFSLYNEQNISLAYARKLTPKISAGMQLHYLHYNLADNYYGSRTGISVSLGMQYKVTDKFRFGFNIFNPTRNKLSEYNNERMPTILKVGFAWQPNSNVLVCVEDEKNIAGKNILKGAIEYRVAKPLYIRTGIAGSPANASFGAGLEFKQFKLDVAANYHPILGFSPHFALSANF